MLPLLDVSEIVGEAIAVTPLVACAMLPAVVKLNAMPAPSACVFVLASVVVPVLSELTKTLPLAPGALANKLTGLEAVAPCTVRLLPLLPMLPPAAINEIIGDITEATPVLAS